MLKDLVRERLIAAADEIFEMFERTIASYEEQLCRAREENERHRRRLGDVCNTPNVDRVREPPSMKEKKEDPEPPLVLKEEEEETDVDSFHPTAQNKHQRLQRGGASPDQLCDGYDAEELWRSRAHAEGDTDWDPASPTEDDDSASVADPSASRPGDAEREEREASAQKGNKRKRRPHEWLRSKMKEARNKGKAYVNTRGIAVPGKNLVALPRHLCRHRCAERVTEEERRMIFRNFWDLGHFDLQNAFICGSVKLVGVQRRRPQRRRRDAGEAKNRSYSRKYSLTAGQGGHVEVCKTFFLATLCVSNGRVDRALQKQAEKGPGSPSPDGRGKHDNRRRVSDESLRLIKEHIASFPEHESRRAQRDGKYLTVAQMHRLYREQCRQNGREPEKEWLYRRIFLNQFGLSFRPPGEDACLLAPLGAKARDSPLLL
ncbi:uncharacterized protein LOC133475673 isoform X1 [Phyllopteryx taeniolatus]|uniref:uncharacterized protein LOC133475673 isoform X1 n=2 Tax=Phyllopteryx taeniolatus TaxID=161469 RepID=UPI002AD567AF|nr:uncharacterized protein LOC133475673 isoform X1 [Phyllopteryx taeniolatus]